MVTNTSRHTLKIGYASLPYAQNIHPSFRANRINPTHAMPTEAFNDCYDALTDGRIPLSTQRLERHLLRECRIGRAITDDVGYHISSRFLVSARQARALAGLDTQDMDMEIADRALQFPGHWGQLGKVIEATGWRTRYCRRRLQRHGLA